jgi:hypothetical protein
MGAIMRCCALVVESQSSAPVVPQGWGRVMTYHLQVYGTTWGGAVSVYEYTITRNDADSLLAQHADPEAFAGDFQNVRDWRLVSESTLYEGTHTIKRRIDTFKTLRGFRSGMTPKRFHGLLNCY